MHIGRRIGWIGCLGLFLAAPVMATDISVQHGRELFGAYCAHCHGANMVNPGNSSFDLRTFPLDDKERFVNSVTHGKNAMPAWGDILSRDEIDALWEYVKHGHQK